MKYLSWIMIFLATGNIYTLFRPGTFPEINADQKPTDVIESYSDYYSYINWSTGKMITEYSVPITYDDPNIGRNVANVTQKLKNELLVFAARAITQIKVSSLFIVNNYFTRDESVRSQLLSLLYGLEVENSVIEKSTIKGNLVFPLYGEKGISSSFYKNIKPEVVTNFLKKDKLNRYYDTLIIDMVMFKNFNMSLMPRILSQKGQLVHGVETVDPKILQKQGPVHYASSITEALNHPARGKRIAYVLPAEPSGTFNSDIILFDSDIEDLFSQQRSIDNFKQGRVIVIHSSDSKK